MNIPLKQRLASRKFIWANALEVLWISLFLIGKLDQSGFIDLTQLTVGGYLLANVGDKFGTKNSS